MKNCVVVVRCALVEDRLSDKRMLKKRSTSTTKKRVKKIDRTRSKTSQIYITDTKDFSATIQEVDGKKILAISHRNWYDTQINKFRVGEKVSIYVSSRRPKRSEAQNRYYWGVYLPLIAEETGERDLDRLHKLFSGKFLTTGIVEVLGEKVRLTKSTTTLSKNDFSEYIMAIEAETGVQAPPTQEYEIGRDYKSN